MSRLNTIIGMTGTTPEQRFLAAMLSEAITEARFGCPLAHAWLAHCSVEYLAWLSGDIAPEALRERLLSMIRTTRPAPSVAEAVCRMTTQTELGLEAA